MKLNILYAATLFLSSSILEVNAGHGYWGISANCASGFTSYTPTGMETACYWGDKAIGEACTSDIGTGGCAHGFCNSGNCAVCTGDFDCAHTSGAVCASGLGCTSGNDEDACTANDQCTNGFCAFYDDDVAVDTKRCHDGSNGSDCDANDQCVSGYCDTSSNDCHDGNIDDSCGAGSDCQSGYCDDATSLCATPLPSDPCLFVNCGNGGKCISMGPNDVSCRCENTFQEFLNSNGKPYCDCLEGTSFNADANRCFAPPTMAPSKEPTVSPTASPTSSPSDFPTETKEEEDICADDEVGTFVLDNDEVVGCDWLTKNNEETRKNNYCYRHEVKTLCPLTCNFCECEDDASYTFTLVKTGNTVDCSWLTKNKSKMEQRIANYCTEDFDGGMLHDACTKSCGKCLAADA
ncbi:predicted protein [Chaetoceros tenuissimus]|uniref:EGF-like domain-containing protein n=1 Tax=Chaetoceros tenuissimus TaxID=426638 RepID=A0AAD3D4B5_9STRA|nr:predicted protein [Chaetoceros tenuissimus]